MSEKIEIEAKLKVDSFSKIWYKLIGLNAKFLGKYSLTDYYYDDQNMTLTKLGKCFRLRKQQTDTDEKLFLTYKGVQEKSNLKRRQEIEFEVKTESSVRKLLSILGYEQTLIVEKRRSLWRLVDCEIALDQLLLLGSFVEIEGPNEVEIAAVQKMLGLSNSLHETKSYASLIRERKIYELFT